MKKFVMPGCANVQQMSLATGTSEDTNRRRFANVPGVLWIGVNRSSMRVPWAVLDAEMPGAAAVVQEWLRTQAS